MMCYQEQLLCYFFIYTASPQRDYWMFCQVAHFFVCKVAEIWLDIYACFKRPKMKKVRRKMITSLGPDIQVLENQV